MSSRIWRPAASWRRNIVHGYDAGIAKRNDLPDLWGYMIIDPEGKTVEKGQVGSYFTGGADNVYVLPKKLKEISKPGEFMVIDAKMSDNVKNALWPMELGTGTTADFRKFSGDQKQLVQAAVAKYGEKEVEKIRTLAEGDIESQFFAYDRANALCLQLKGTDTAKSAKKAALALEANGKFKRELAAKKAYERCEKMPADSSNRSTAMKVLIKRFEGTVYGDKAKEAVASAESTAKAEN